MAAELTPLTGRTKTTRAALGQALAQVRRRGYAVENEEATVGDAGIAAPIVEPRRRARSARSAWSARPNGCSAADQAELARAVAESARSVSRDLGAGRGGGGAVRAR